VKHLFIVGRPGVGKTTLIKRLTQELRGCPIDGFYTEELRENHERLGFWLSSVDGRQALLAHRHLIHSPHRVGPYRVNAAVLDELGIGIIRRAMQQALILFLDEIGWMELCSPTFQQAVEDAVTRGPRLVATVGVQPVPFLVALKSRKDVELIPLTKTNWNAVFEELLVRLQALCDEDEQVRTLQRQADRICEMIVSSDVPEIDIEIQEAKLREAVAQLFPDKQALYHLLYETRFRRLWQQFRQS